jgi:hypothetical protein
MTGREGRHEQFKPELARLAAASALDTAQVPAMQFSEIQASGVAHVRWPVGSVCIASGSLHVLLETVLLADFA